MPETAQAPLLRVLRGESLSPPPIWLMRQAGRYLPEYRRIREKAGSFLNLCYTPELAAEVTLQPLRRFDLDAAILFADILLVPQAMGMRLDFIEGEGPRLDWPGGEVDLAALADPDAIDERLAPVFETIRILRGELAPSTPLIGFAGAPWTVATYMIAGHGTPDKGPARHMMYAEPARFGALMALITEATVRYLLRQIEAGAQTVMLFDSWAGVLTPAMFERHAVRPVAQIVAALHSKFPDFPIIGFPRGEGALYTDFATATGVAAVGLGSQTSLEKARALMPGVALQGNLDPMLMVVGGSEMREEARKIVTSIRGTPHIFNLGHGITPDADPRHVNELVEAVRN